MEKKNRKSLLADGALMLVAFIWGSGFPITKIALISFTPMFIMTVRFLGAFLLLAIIFRKHITKLKKIEVIGGVISGIVLFGGFATQTLGLQYTTSSKQAFLTGTYVVMVPFFFWFVYKKLPDVFNIIAALLTVIGIYLLSITGGADFNKGDLLTLLCAVFFAAHILVVGYYVKKMHPITLTILQSGVAAIISIIILIMTEPFPSQFDRNGILSVLYLTVCSTVIAYLIQNIAQKYTAESHVAIILSLEAVFGTLLSVLWLGDIFTIRMFLGCLIIFMGILTAETKWSFIRKRFKSSSLDIK